MFKKSLFMLIALAMAATMVMAPMASSAAGISDKVYFDLDFSTGEAKDVTGNYEYSEDGSVSLVPDDPEDPEFLIEEDSTLNRKVGHFYNWGGLIYASKGSSPITHGYDLSQGLTLETYIYLEYNNATHSSVFLELGATSIHLQNYNDASDNMVGFRCGDTLKSSETGPEAGDPEYRMRNAYDKTGSLETGKWLHLVGTTDGTKNEFYLNGELVASEERASNLFRAAYANPSSDIFIGTSILPSGVGMEGKMAFARVYKAYADADTVKLMHTAAVNGETVEPSGDPSGSPSNSPSGSPSNSPSGSPSNSPSGSPSNSPSGSPSNSPSGNPSNNNGQTPNTKTFDLGIVSLAAVALSSAVAIKKRK